MGEFALIQGLRQGDPLFPFLILIAAEVFSVLIRKAMLLSYFEGIKVGRDAVRVSHLQFADNSVIMSKASADNAKTIKGLLQSFEPASD